MAVKTGDGVKYAMTDAENGLTLFDEENVRGRSCGSCKACCTLVPVAEINKTSPERCKHLVSKGCSIYERRAGSCRFWSCRWLFDKDVNTRRPDHAGYVIDSALDTLLIDGREVQAFQLWVDPARRDAHRDPALRAYLELMGKRHGMATMVRFSAGGEDQFFLVPPSLCTEGVWLELKSDLPVFSEAEMKEKIAAARAAS